MIRRFSHTLSLVLVLFSSLSLAKPIDQLFEELKDSGENYEIVGTVCEQVARIELYDHYNKEAYDIVTGIIYADSDRVIGELDVVVINRATNKAVLVGEVKCWKDLNGALKKAKSQRQRFINTLASKKEITMYTKEDEEFSKTQFLGNRQYVAIAQNGAKAAGFELDLENTLAELMELRQRLMNCQDQGQCLKLH